MAEVAAEIKEATKTPEKIVEAIEVDSEKEPKVIENAKQEKKTNGVCQPLEKSGDDEKAEKENGKSDSTEVSSVKRKSEKGDVTDGVAEEESSPEKKAKLEKKEEAVENGDEKAPAEVKA